MIKRVAAIFVALAIPIAFLETPAEAQQLQWLDAITTSDQVVVVTATHRSATVGTLRAYQRVNGQWDLIQSPAAVFLGRSGLVPGVARVQSSGTTPMGTFDLLTAFGRKTNPGTQMPYTRVDHNDAWTYNPKVPSTYNVFQSVDRTWATYGKYVEHLWQLGPQYDYVITTSFNQPPGPITQGHDGVNRATSHANIHRGGGIFLHVSKGIPTAGCVSMQRNVMRALLQWLEPSAHPVVVIGLAKDFNS